eukprot:gnl/TRDRNA2_/TRDRNA2_207877_c0_seq1.p1 gnl/TRDRNA2_/TRDRNA2_207877_c0~~gnl/TRDRNA2_/TRDRNA2_207877_c0_seq1.p1  ORF type:complete len:166 (-),score=13.45 gnl/TRDRNA2_/TRDRNA2_207877_c0_seq1:440-937(-)
MSCCCVQTVPMMVMTARMLFDVFAEVHGAPRYVRRGSSACRYAHGGGFSLDGGGLAARMEFSGAEAWRRPAMEATSECLSWALLVYPCLEIRLFWGGGGSSSARSSLVFALSASFGSRQRRYDGADNEGSATTRWKELPLPYAQGSHIESIAPAIYKAIPEDLSG